MHNFYRDVSRSTGIDGQTLQELKEVLATKKQRLEEGAGEEELWKADEAMHRILKAGEQRVNDRNSVLLTPNAVSEKKSVYVCVYMPSPLSVRVY